MVALAVLLAVCPAGVGVAHTDGPPPPVEPGIVWVHPARWSWTHGWEANRALYLRPPAQGAAQRMDPAALAEMRRRAADTLIKYLDHPHPRVKQAAVLALGLTGSNEAVPVLTRAWHLSYFVNREVLYALSLTGARSVSEQTIDEADGSNNPVLLEFMLSMLGQLFGPEPPTPLDRLLVGSNYTIKDADRVAVMALGNECFANFLLPAFGHEWRGEDLHDPETPTE